MISTIPPPPYHTIMILRQKSRDSFLASIEPKTGAYDIWLAFSTSIETQVINRLNAYTLQNNNQPILRSYTCGWGLNPLSSHFCITGWSYNTK